jgi:predicted RNA-binding protein YlxR (DUF448 family)
LIDEAAVIEGQGRGRTRQCAVTRRVLPESELIRFVAAPDGSVAVDLKARLPGRGVWISRNEDAVAAAVRKNVFARSLRASARPAADLADQVGARLKESALARLGLARKAGAAVAGATKVEAAIARREIVALLIASDAAEDSRRKMEQALRRHAPGRPVLRCFGATELGLAMGRADVIHAAVLPSPAGRSFVEAADRFQRYGGMGNDRARNEALEPQDVMDE